MILEGIIIFFDKHIRDLIDLKLYVDTPDDIRFIRRLKRDISERGRTVDSVIEQYVKVVRPGHYEFVEPTKAYADLVIPEGGFNDRAMEAADPVPQAGGRLTSGAAKGLSDLGPSISAPGDRSHLQDSHPPRFPSYMW